MKRKIIKQGHNTLTMTLPSEWVKKLNLKAGDEIDLNEKGGSLMVNGKQNNENKSTTIDITGFTGFRCFGGSFNQHIGKATTKLS